MENYRKKLLNITGADFLIRSAYQMGKSPLLPIFAASIGAQELFIGFILSVSTLSGMVLKPLFGILSDRWGRKVWLLIGTAIFAFSPFIYWFVSTPAQLFVVRLIHGLATAIYGPVTLAYVAEISSHRRGENFGWFGLSRGMSYVIGPAAAGVLMSRFNPAEIFTVIGFISMLAFLPVVSLPADRIQHPSRAPLKDQVSFAWRTVSSSYAIWLVGGYEAVLYSVLYALKTFLPFYLLEMGLNIAAVGFFFSLQEGDDRNSGRLGSSRCGAWHARFTAQRGESVGACFGRLAGACVGFYPYGLHLRGDIVA